MRSFWISLLAFVLLMCGCKSKEVVSGYSDRLQMGSDVSILSGKAKVDTTKTIRSEQLKENKRIVETLIIKEYDKESGKPIKETKATRETTQDSDKVVSTEEERGVSEVKNDSLSHIADVSKKVESETKEESKGGQEAFGKWIGIVIGCIIGLLIVYLLKILRIN